MALIAKVPFTEGAGAPIETISGAPLTLVAGSMAWETIAGKGAVRLTTAGPLNLGILTLPLVASPLSPPGTVLLARRLYTAAGQVPLFSETSESFESDVAPGRRCRLGANAPDVLTSGGVDPIGPTVCGWFGQAEPVGGSCNGQQWVGSYAVDTTNVERWGFSGGAAGYKIYYNSDTPVAGHASFVFDSAPRRAFALGWCPHQGTRPQQPWSQAFLWFAIHNTQLSDAAVAAWMADPYA